MRIGAVELLTKYGSELAVAEAFLEGRITYGQHFVEDVVDKVTLEAARIRIEARKKSSLEERVTAGKL